MRIEPIHIKNLTTLIRDYRNGKPSIMDHFDYGITDYTKRQKEISSRTYQRQELADTLMVLNKEWGTSEKSLENIERLKQPESVVVIGGQQAGLLTGPLYSVNKVISILQLARQQEKQLGVPVIPVFWIAGEDHDFEEINHVYMGTQQLKKYKVQDRNDEKRSVSHMNVNHEILNQWLDVVWKQVPETEFTHEINATIRECIAQSTTYVDFFARMIVQLFHDTGLVLIDSGNDLVRRLERDYFVNMIENQAEISNGVCNSYAALQDSGYSVSLDVSPENGNLFYHKDGERILLTKNEEGNWVGKQNEVILTSEELIRVAKESPEKLSNNVITRPLMQDLLFPTLAFIGGPGEVSYWSVLKPAFHVLGIKMPPVVTRLSFTYVERKVEKVLQKYGIPLADVINHGVLIHRDNWFKAKMNPPIEETVNSIKAVITEAHEPLQTIAGKIRSDIQSLAEKNLQYLIRDIEFLEKRMVKALEERYHKELSDFALLENVLHPNGLQERMWNPLPFLNGHGLRFFETISTMDCSVLEEHYLVYI